MYCMLLILHYSISKIDMFIGIIVAIYSELFGLCEENPNIYYEGSSISGEKKIIVKTLYKKII